MTNQTDPTKVERLEGAVYVDVCPDCGTPDTGHPMDPPGHCPHSRECFEPEQFIPAQEVERLEQTLRELVEAIDALPLSLAARGHRMGEWRKADAALSQAREILGGSE